jgi:hypothetical protein
MPVRKSRLTRAQEAEHAYYVRQMQSEDIDVEIPEEWEENSRALDIELAPSPESIVFETSTGGIFYAIWMRLLALRSALTLIDWDMTTGWDDQIVAESFDGGSPICRLGPQDYRQCEVLNQRIERNLSFRRGQIVEGWILANGLRPIPPEYHDCSTAPFEVAFLDQFRREYSAQGTVSVLRKSQPNRTNLRSGTGLYGLGDTGLPRELTVSEQSALRYRELVASEKGRREPRWAPHRPGYS